MFPILNVGPFAIATSPLLLILGLISGISLMNFHAKKLSHPVNTLENLIMISSIGGLIAARFGFVIRNWQSFTMNILPALRPSTTMLETDFGVVCGIIIGVIYSQKKKIFNWETLDYLSIVLITVMPFYYLSRFASGNAIGKASTMPWAILLGGSTRHPVQVYLTISSLIILLIIFLSTKMLRKTMFIQDGYQFLFFVTLLSFNLLVMEYFYAESRVIFKIINSNQFYAFLVIVLCFSIFLYRTRDINTIKKIKFSEELQNED